jgi:hypothetical protein
MTQVNTLKCVEAEFTGKMPEKYTEDGGYYQKQYYYSNGYGASVIWSKNSYGAKDGLFEVAVLDASGSIVYDTPITDDVCGFLNFGQVADVLQQIRNLPVRGTK